jgi:hypothetical protein
MGYTGQKRGCWHATFASQRRIPFSRAVRHAGPPMRPMAHLVFNQPKLLPITTVSPPPSQVVRSTPLGMACSALPVYGAPRPGLRFAHVACRCVFAFVRKAATYRCLRAAASWAGSGYSPGIRSWEGLLLS